MHDQTRNIIEDCTAGSDQERLTFPQVVGKLMSAGVERYHADLQRSEKTYFLPDGQSVITPAHPIDEKPAMAFQPDGVEAAVRAIQSGQIRYLEFCRLILRAGCVGYIVSMTGRRAVYYGRSGETHVEHFPGAA